MRIVCLILAVPAMAWSQSTAPTTFPADAVAMTPEKGSAVCVLWQRFPASCSHAMLAGEVVYIKRANNGEVIALQPS